MLEFIDLIQVDNKPHEKPRMSSFSISDKFPGLRTVGELPHNYRCEPRDVQSARRMIKWLKTWIKDEKRTKNDAF